jgi:transposase
MREEISAQTTLTKEDTLLIGMDLSAKSWRICAGTLTGRRERQKSLRTEDVPQVFREELSRAKQKLDLPESAPVVVVYEAGRDGFWPYRLLTEWGLEVIVVDPSSLEVPQRSKRRKTDRLDARELLGKLRHRMQGERPWREVRIPSAEEEDERQLTRERDRLIKERTQLRSRVWSLLAKHGLRLELCPGFSESLDSLRTPSGSPLGPDLVRDLAHTDERLQLLERQIRAVEHEQKERLKAPRSRIAETARQLTQVKSVALQTAWGLSTEFFGWREFSRTREVGGASGLVSVPFNSGCRERDQGISKNGPRRVRQLAIELAWRWQHHQREDRLTLWYHERFAGGGRRHRKVGIVGLARKILVALWKFLEFGELHEGMELNA